MIRSKVWLLAVVVLLQIGRGQFAKAGIVTWDMTGTITFLSDSDNLLGDAISVGSPFSFSFSYESTTQGGPPDRGESDFAVFYDRALTGGSGQIGDLLFDLNPEAFRNGILVSSQFDDTLGIGGMLAPSGEFSEFNNGIFSLLFSGPIGTFPDLALPLVPPSRDDLFQGDFSLSFFPTFPDSSPSVGMAGVVTEIVPEPGTIYLFAVAAICGMFIAFRARLMTSRVLESA